VTLSIELNDSQVEQFQRMIPVELALPPWNYTESLDKAITVHVVTYVHCRPTISCRLLSNVHTQYIYSVSWLLGTVVERRSLAGELYLSCARPVVDG